MKKLLLSLILVSSLLVGLKAQTGSIMGKVIDSKTKETIPGANVYIMRGNNPYNTQTDVNGSFHLKNLQSGIYILYVSYTGYTTQEIKNVPVNSNKINRIETILLNPGVDMAIIDIIGYRD